MGEKLDRMVNELDNTSRRIKSKKKEGNVCYVWIHSFVLAWFVAIERMHYSKNPRIRTYKFASQPD